MVNISQYGQKEIEACRMVLLELIHLFGEIKDEVVIIGGWIPYFLIPNSSIPHIGSLDIDVALNFAKIRNNTYQTILKAFLKRGYKQDKEQSFRFFRTVEFIGSKPITVEIDLMSGEYRGTSKSHRTQKIQDVHARKVRGCDLAFNKTVEVTLEGTLPDGGKDKVSFKIASIVPFIVMKGMAIDQRIKEKDAYDIFYCVENYPGGIEQLRKEFEPFMNNKLVIEGLEKIRNKFASIEHVGPKWVADFLEIEDKEEREIKIRRVYEMVSEFLTILNK